MGEKYGVHMGKTILFLQIRQLEHFVFFQIDAAINQDFCL
jgi:hypothetical protein